MKFLPQLLLASALFCAVLCGRITPWGDPIMTNPNSKTITSITLYFTLDNTLPAGHLLRIGFPFTSAPSIGGSGVSLKNAAGTSIASSGSYYYANSTGFNSVYFYFVSDLVKATAYTMTITFSSSPTDSAGFLGFLQMETMSPADSITAGTGGDTPITYDLNNAFAPINIYQQPSTSGTFVTNSSDANAGNGATTYVRLFNIKPNADILFPATLIISWDSSATATTTSCTSVSSGISSTNATAFSSSQYSCTLTASKMTVQLNQAWLANQTQTWSVSMTNPSSGTTINVYAVIQHKYNYNMTDQLNTSFSVSAAATSTTSYNVSSTKIILSWGIDPVGMSTAITSGSNWTTTHKNIFKIYGGPAGTLKNYQALKFVFGTNATLPTLSGTNTYTVTVAICTTSTACDVLENSISSSITNAACSFVSGSSSPANVITCTGISTLASSGNNISARIWLDSSAIISGTPPSGTVNDSNFGIVSISASNSAVSVTSGSVDTGYKNAGPNGDVLVNFNGNGPLAGIAASDTTSLNNLKGSGYSVSTASFKNIAGGVFGSSSSTLYSLMLITKGNRATFGATGTALDKSSGIDLFLNPYLWTASSKTMITNCFVSNQPNAATLTQSTSGAGVTPPLHCYSATYTQLYSRVRTIITGAITTPSTVENGSNAYMTFYWDSAFNLTAYTGTSLQVTTNIADYYGAWYDLNGNSTLTVSATPSGASVSDLGELGITGLQNTAASSDQVAITNNFYFSSPILAPIGTATSGYGTARKVWIAGADADSASTYTSNTAAQLLRIKVTFTSGTDTYPSSGKVALFIKNIAAINIEPMGPVGTSSGAYANSTLTLPQTLGVSTVRCFSNSGLQVCQQIRRPRALPATTTYNYLDFYQIMTSDVNVTSGTSFSLSIVIRPKHDYGTNTPVYRLGFYVSSTGMYYIQGYDSAFDTGSYAATVSARTSGACTASNTGMYFVNGSSDVVGKTVNTSLSLTHATSTTYQGTVTNGLGGGIYCVQWDFRGSSFSVSASSLEATTDKCFAFDYQSLESSSIAWYCVFCPITQNVTTPATVTLNNFVAPPFQTIPTSSFNILWLDSGATSERSVCTSFAPSGGSTGWLTNNISSFTSTGTYINMTGHKTTITFTAPSTLKNAASVTINGRSATSGTTADNSFPYATAGTDFQCRIVASSSVGTPSAYFTCTAAIASPTITVTLPSSNAWNAIANGTSWVIYLWGMLGSTSASAVTANFSMSTIASAGNGGLAIDASPSTANAQWPVVAGNLTFGITNIVYQRPYANARGFIRWDFWLNSQRPFFSMDKIVFNIEVFASSTVNNLTSVVKCRVTDTNNAIVQKFRSCTYMSSGTPVGSGTTATVTLAPLTTYSTNSSSPTPLAELDFWLNSSSSAYRVYLTNLNVVANQTSIRTIYGTLYFNANSSAASLSKANTATDFPSLTTVTSFPTNYPTVSKIWAAPNVMSDIVFTIISSQATSDANRIVIGFPSYYSMGLTTRAKFPYCTVNNVNTGCHVEAERSLVIYGIGTTIAANTAMVIRISGITAPYSYTVENFWIQIQSDKTDPGTVIYGGTVADLAYVSQTLSPLHINWWTTSTSNTRATATMTWSFTPLSTADIASGSVVQVIFPETWGIPYMTSTPTCTVTDAASSASYGKTQAIFGHTLSVNISTAISKNAPLSLTCTNMRTMDNESLPLLQDVIIRVADSTGANITLHSGMDNVNLQYTFTKSSALTYLEWTVGTSMSSPLVVTRGTYSGILGLGVSGFASSFSKSFQITNTNTNFAFYPSQFNATVGSSAAATKLGASSSLSTGLYLLSFVITDTTTYTQPGLLWVNVTTSTITLNPSITTTITNPWVSTSSLTKSVPIMFDVTNYLPYSDIIIYAVLGTGNTNFTVSPAYITLTPTNPIGWFIFSTTATASATGSNYVNYTVNGTNKLAYSVATQMQTLQISADSTNGSTTTPNFTITVSSADTSSPIQKLVTFTLTNLPYATIYYVVGLPNQITTDLATMQNSSSSVYNINSQNQAQYGIVTQYGSSSTTGFSPSYVTISNLFPSTTYQINAYAISQYNQQSPMTYLQFTTSSNGGSITRWMFNFTGSYPSSAQRQALLCSICSLVAAPYQMVRTIHGEICGNTTAFYPTSQTNVSGNYSYLPIYFSPFPVASDSSLATITNIMANNLTNMQSSLVAVAAAPALNAVTYDLTSATTAPTTTFASTATTGTTYVYVSGLKMSDAGFIWIVLTSNSTTNLTAAAIKAAGTQNSTGFAGFSVQYYYPGGSTVSANFSGLTAGTTYNVFMVGSNNDPSWLNSFSAVSNIAVTTQGSSNQATFAMNLGTVSLFALALVASFLALF